MNSINPKILGSILHVVFCTFLIIVVLRIWFCLKYYPLLDIFLSSQHLPCVKMYWSCWKKFLFRSIVGVKKLRRISCMQCCISCWLTWFEVRSRFHRRFLGGHAPTLPVGGWLKRDAVSLIAATAAVTFSETERFLATTLQNTW